jgi:hypothetical protein
MVGGEEPVRLGEHGRDNIGKIKCAGDEKDFLDLAVRAADDEQPDGKGRDWDGDIFGNAENLHRSRYAREFSDGVAEVDKECSRHDEKRGTESELLADQVGETFARDDAHARAHLFRYVERDRHGNERP